MISLRRPPARAPRTVERRELCVVLACHELVCALPTRWIERLVLPHEVTVISGQSPDAEGAGRSWQAIRVGDKRYAACNLGTLLGTAPLDAAWALLRVAHHGRELPIALQTGACLVVQELESGMPLPPGAFRARIGAIAAVFPTTLMKNRTSPGEVGVWIDPARLWEPAELDAAAAWIHEESGTPA